MVANLRVRKLMTAGATIIEPNGRCQAPVALTFPDCSKGIGDWIGNLKRWGYAL